MTDVESERLEMLRGSKQRDSLSSLPTPLCSTRLEREIEAWRQKGLGVKIGRRCAYDVKLIANSLIQLRKMKADKKNGQSVDRPDV